MRSLGLPEITKFVNLSWRGRACEFIAVKHISLGQKTAEFWGLQVFARIEKRVIKSNSPPRFLGPVGLRVGSPLDDPNGVEKFGEIVFPVLHHEGLPAAQN